MRERGSISVLGVGVLALIGMAAMLLGQLGADAVRQARATAVADVVAMAAVAEPHAAARVATANRADLVSSRREGFQTEVVVRRDGVMATARAELLPLGWWRCQSLAAVDPVHFESCPSTPGG
ncbi:hypothetical protein [Candidatus Poriferisocius sp.]|uniref:hypothetical protein n=1 Tax=Candidatus Poriferisocius sp. TaxID=3101276 RepID=UPI003B024BA4